jgi:DNA repair exonuclease SbcCD ATPase subunit
MDGLHIISQRLQKTLMFKDVTWEFTPGLSTIYGLNRASTRTSNNGNGAGKSAFFSLLGENLFETPIVGEKQDALKGGVRTVSAMFGDKKVDIVRDGTKLDIMVDGKSKRRTKPMTKAWLAKHLPVDEESWNTYIHIDARVPHPLVMGSSTARKKFFTSFFGLDKLDIERRLFQAELSKLGKVRAAYNEIKTEYTHVKEKLSKYDRDQLKASGHEIQAELDELNAKNSRLQNITQLLAFEKSAKAQLDEFMALCPQGASQDTFDELLETAKWNRKTNKADLEEARDWEQYQRDTRKYTEAYNALSGNARKLLLKLGTKKALEKCRGYSGDRRGLEEAHYTAHQNFKWATKVTEKGKPKKVEEPESTKKELRASLDSLEHQYDHARKFKKGQCEACGQSVEIKDPAKLKARIEKAERLLEQHDVYAAYNEARTEYKKAEKELEASDLEELDAERIKSDKYIAILDELNDLPSRPKKFEGKKLEVKVLERMVEEDKERLRLLEFIQPNLETIIDLHKLSAKHRHAATIAIKLQDKINDCQERLGRIKLKLGLCKELYADYVRIKERIVLMKAQLKDEEALKLLVEGYSDKAMKKMAIKTIASRLMLEVNKYARIVFPEDYTFEFNWESSQMALIVRRKYGKKTLTSDVRKLSGAESKLFTIVLVMALMTFVPKRKRCNVLILDEPTANFSPETTEAFMRILPALNKLFPSIVLITPRTNERYEGAREFTVLKTRTEAKILEGHPSLHKKRLK